MDNSGNIKALSAAFTFGIVVNAASVALFLYIKGHGSSFIRDGPRLALVTFLATSALWAQADFIATLIDTNSTTGCQTAITFASAFDQLARISLVQALFWGANRGIKTSSAEALVSQGLILLRFVLGGIFVGVQRPQLDTICVTRTQVLPLGIAIVVTDGLFAAGLLAKAVSVGFRVVQGDKTSADRSKAILLTICGLGIWTASSAPMLLGIKSIDLIARTAIPAGSLALLIGILTLFKDSLTLTKEHASIGLPETSTSHDSDMTRNLQSRDISTAGSFYPPSRYEEIKTGILASNVAGANSQDISLQMKGGLPLITRPYVGQATTGMGGVKVQGQLFPPMRGQPAPSSLGISKARKHAPKLAARKGEKLVISNPILRENNDQNPLRRIPTIDLKTAARYEAERRAMAQLPDLLAPRMAPQPPTTYEQTMRSQSEARSDVENPPISAVPTKEFFHPVPEPASMAITTSVQLSPGVEEIRRRSPGQAPQTFKPETSPITPMQISQSPISKSSTPPKRPPRPATLELPTPSPVPQTVITPPPESPVKARGEQLQYMEASPPRIPFSDSTRVGGMQPLQRQSTLKSGSISSNSPSVEPRMSILPRNNSVKMNIRPSRQRPPSLPEEPPKTVKTPVLSRVKSGLPSNPRAHAIKTPAQEQGMSQEHTVMFINNIEYHNPGAVQDIIAEASDKQLNQPAGLGLARVTSVVHRPRPIPRKPEVDRAIFPAEDSPNLYQHRRSLSNSSARNKRSTLRSVSASMSQVPPLPPAPKSAGNPLRQHPNDTRSMTWDEKMEIFYPGPASDGSNTSKSGRRRSSSVPEIPTLPEAYFDRAKNSVGEQVRQNIAQQTVNSTGIPGEGNAILNIAEALIHPQEIRNISKFSMTTYQSTPHEVSSRLSDEGSKRRSSPVLPAENLSPSSSTDERIPGDETTTNWGSVHSPAKSVNLQRFRVVEVPAVPKLRQSQDKGAMADTKTLSVMSQEDGKETMTVMLDPSISQNIGSPQGSQHGKVSLKNGARSASWHRRVGDTCPTFSERRQTRKLRKGPPPAPLLLNRTNKVPVVIQAEPSPLEPPQHALEVIKVQLKKLEEPNRESTGSEQRQRITLLANLETEMGQQENQWRQMRNTLVSRDSISTLDTSPKFGPPYGSMRNSDLESQQSLKARLAERRASRRLHGHSQTSDDLLSASSRASEYSHGIDWQKKLAEAQMEFMGNRPDLSARASTGMNFLAVSHSSVQLGSPSPPETDDSGSEYDEEIERFSQMDVKCEVRVAGLWCPSDIPVTRATAASLWTPPVKPRAQSLQPAEDPGRSARSKARKDLEPLTIDSSRLWEKPIVNRRFSAGLWRGATPPHVCDPDPSSKAEKVVETKSRPVTQRPPRRSKRVTLLPDILESPKPLADKRGTLGIFQFPWGDVSDTASVQPRRQMYTAMSGTMTSGGSINNMHTERIVSPDTYSQSFFDDYEEEDDGDNFVDDFAGDYDIYGSDYADAEIEDDDEEDDGFDETTLWEIASLLKSSEVPSRDSVFPTQDSGSPGGGSSKGQGEVQGSPHHSKHQEQEKVGNVSKIGHGDKPITFNAAPGLPSDDDGAELSEWKCNTERDKGDNQSGGTNPLILETTNDIPSPPPLQGAALWANNGTPHGQVEVTPRQGQASQGTTQANQAQRQGLATTTVAEKEKVKGTLPQPDARSWSAYLAQVSVTDSAVRAPRRKAELVVEGVEGDESETESQGLWTVSTADPVWINDRIAPPDPPALPPMLGLWGNIGIQALISQRPRQQQLELGSLWTPSSAEAPPAKGLAQPDDQACIIHLASTHGIVPIQNPRATTTNSLPSSSSSQLSQLKDDSFEHHALLWNITKNTNTFSNSMALWAPSAPAIISPKGLPQPDTSIWNSYLPSLDNALRVVPRKAEPASIESASLWSPSPKTIEIEAEDAPTTGLWGAKKQASQASSLPGMWEPPATIKKVSYGLSQPEQQVWETYLPASEDDVRVKPQKVIPASIESSSLWSPPPKTLIAPSTGFLWSAPKFIVATESPASPLREAVNYGMWTAPAAVEDEEEPQGLFSLSHKRSEFRSSTLEPAALNMSRKPRAAAEPFPDFGFSYLWNESPLWRGPKIVVEEQAEGLFSLNHRRTNFRSTSAAPAALEMLRKPRVSNEPLPKLTSNSLWSVPTTRVVSHDWIALSTVGPRRASAASSASDDESVSTEATSVDDDVASVKDTVEDVIAASIRRIEATAAQWKDALNEAINASKTETTAASQSAKSALWAKRTDTSSTASPSPAPTAQTTSMWQPSTAYTTAPEAEYTISEPDSARSTTLRNRRKSEDEVESTPLSYSNFLRLTAPDTPRDFGAQALWTPGEEDVVFGEERTWLDESVYRLSSVLQLS
ncbi:Fc.00g060780.m01.CDS01 [Cosmosporella sp. VM-42]